MPDRLRQAVWGSTSTRVRRTKGLRDPAINTYRAVARTVLRGDPPRVFANSIPKSGTHLLTQLLAATPALWFSGIHIIDKHFREDRDEPGDGRGAFDPYAFADRITRVRDGQYLTAHVGALRGVPEIVAAHGFASLLMIRDPRDIAVSLAHYYASNERLNTYRHFSALGSFDEQLLAVITGAPGDGHMLPVPTLGERLTKYRPWLVDPRTVVIRFEDLVGSAGGGSDEAQREAVTAVLRACRRDDRPGLVDRVSQQVFAPHAATFRRGTIGQWPEFFTAEHHAALEQVAPGEIAAFGYADS